MKTMIATVTAVTLLGVGLPRSVAGDREWATAGKVLTGVVAASVLARALEPPPVYVAPPTYTYTYTYAYPGYPGTTVVAPPVAMAAPVYVAPPPPPPPVYVVPPPPVVMYGPPACRPIAPVYVPARPVVWVQVGPRWHGHRH